MSADTQAIMLATLDRVANVITIAAHESELRFTADTPIEEFGRRMFLDGLDAALQGVRAMRASVAKEPT